MGSGRKTAYYKDLIEAINISLDEGCYYYIKYQFDHQNLLMPHQWIKEAYQDLSFSLKREK